MESQQNQCGLYEGKEELLTFWIDSELFREMDPHSSEAGLEAQRMITQSTCEKTYSNFITTNFGDSN